MTSSYSELEPKSTVENVSAPYKSQIMPGKLLSVFDGWQSWMSEADASMLTADAIYFWDQTVKPAPNLLSWGVDLRSPTKGAPPSKRSVYLIGNELTLYGALSLSFDPPMPPPPVPTPGKATIIPEAPFAGLFIATNALVLDRQLSGLKLGPIDSLDLRQYPILSVSGKGGTGVVINTRNIILGATARDLPQRVWTSIGLPANLSDVPCPISDRLLKFATKGPRLALWALIH